MKKSLTIDAMEKRFQSSSQTSRKALQDAHLLLQHHYQTLADQLLQSFEPTLFKTRPPTLLLQTLQKLKKVAQQLKKETRGTAPFEALFEWKTHPFQIVSVQLQFHLTDQTFYPVQLQGARFCPQPDHLPHAILLLQACQTIQKTLPPATNPQYPTEYEAILNQTYTPPPIPVSPLLAQALQLDCLFHPAKQKTFFPQPIPLKMENLTPSSLEQDLLMLLPTDLPNTLYRLETYSLDRLYPLACLLSDSQLALLIAFETLRQPLQNHLKPFLKLLCHSLCQTIPNTPKVHIELVPTSYLHPLQITLREEPSPTPPLLLSPTYETRFLPTSLLQKQNWTPHSLLATLQLYNQLFQCLLQFAQPFLPTKKRRRTQPVPKPLQPTPEPPLKKEPPPEPLLTQQLTETLTQQLEKIRSLPIPQNEETIQQVYSRFQAQFPDPTLRILLTNRNLDLKYETLPFRFLILDPPSVFHLNPTLHPDPTTTQQLLLQLTPRAFFLYLKALETLHSLLTA